MCINIQMELNEILNYMKIIHKGLLDYVNTYVDKLEEENDSLKDELAHLKEQITILTNKLSQC